MTRPDVFSGSDPVAALLADARALEAPPSEAFMARVLADAAEVSAQRRIATPAPAPRPAPRRGLLAGFWELMGGARPAAAFAGALCLGLIAGAYAPDLYARAETMTEDPLSLAFIDDPSVDLVNVDAVPQEGS